MTISSGFILSSTTNIVMDAPDQCFPTAAPWSPCAPQYIVKRDDINKKIKNEKLGAVRRTE